MFGPRILSDVLGDICKMLTEEIRNDKLFCFFVSEAGHRDVDPTRPGLRLTHYTLQSVPVCCKLHIYLNSAPGLVTSIKIKYRPTCLQEMLPLVQFINLDKM